jgi:squalene-hopene/tetraprenyl-beta-curcumene cyclase
MLCNRQILPLVFLVLASVAATTVVPSSVRGDSLPEAVTLENVVPPTANSTNEPLAKEYSKQRAVHFLDSAALNWQKQRKCFTCHTNYAFLYARPFVSADAAAHREVRKFAEQLVTERWEQTGPRWDAEVIATAAALSFNDARTSGTLHPVTHTALERMWTIQKPDGGWNWLKCGWPPMESDDHYGVTLAALAVGFAPDDYAKSESAKKGVARIRSYLQNNPSPTLHHATMVLWASTYHDDLLSKAERQATIDKLFALQKTDGGWGLATLGDWERADGLQQDTTSSDGYGTGFVVYVLRQAMIPKDDARLQRAVVWLKSHQRESGRWFTRSLNKDSKHYITHAGSAFAVMALAECDALE